MNILSNWKNLYGKNTSFESWYDRLVGGLKSRNFVQSKVDTWLLFKEDLNFLSALITLYATAGLQTYV